MIDIYSTEFEANKKLFISLLRSTKREGIEQLISFLEESDFFFAPASISHHLNVAGGLLIHSLNVYHVLHQLNELFHFTTEEHVIIMALLHDLDKVYAYVPNATKTGIHKSKPYKWTKKPTCTHGQGSVELIERFIPLTQGERRSILHHHWGYEEGFLKSNIETNMFEQHYEGYMLHIADMHSSKRLEKQEE